MNNTGMHCTLEKKPNKLLSCDSCLPTTAAINLQFLEDAEDNVESPVQWRAKPGNPDCAQRFSAVLSLT